MKVYIAGKVSNKDYGQVFVKFNATEFQLKRKGYEVVNPVRLCSSNWDWNRCMRTCITAMLKCDAICPLLDWTENKGAKMEMYIAEVLGFKIIIL